MILSMLVPLLLPHQDSTQPLMIVPTPTSVIRREGRFQVVNSTRIVVDNSLQDDVFAANQLREELGKDFGVRPPLATRTARRSIELVRLHQKASSLDEGDSYTLIVSPEGIKIQATTSAGIFYGIQSLKQLIRSSSGRHSIPDCVIVDHPALKLRGWQHDISRGPIPTLEFLKSEVRTLSEFKLNMFTLYTEHVFKLKKYPFIAPDDGITAEEVSELCKYAEQYHVQVVGNFQSFGHFANILRHAELADLAENPNVISPANPKSYQFLNDVYSEIAPAYASPLFTINCDEVGGLGSGPSKDLVKQIGVGGVYAQHINRIAALLKNYGKTPMMWGDIALNFPDIVPQLPKDLIVLPWAYDARPNFDGEILPFTKFGLRFIVSPGVSCWGQIWPDMRNATVNISNFVRDGAKNGAMGMLNTSWDDSGQNLFNDNWFEFAWGAECSWNPAIPKAGEDADAERDHRFAVFASEFPAVFFGVNDPSISDEFLALSDLRKNRISGGMRDSTPWRNPTATIVQQAAGTAARDFVQQTLKLSEAFEHARQSARYNADSLRYAVFAAEEAGLIGQCITAVQQSQAGDLSGVRLALGQVRTLKQEYTDLWRRENRNWWLDKNLARFDTLSKELQRLLESKANGSNL